MKSRLVKMLLFVLIFNYGFPIQANAELIGCPESWVPASESWGMGTNGQPQELEQLKKSLGFNVVITPLIYEVSQDASKWIDLGSFSSASPRGPESPDLGTAFEHIFANGYGRYSYKIQVAGCKDSATRYYRIRPFNGAKLIQYFTEPTGEELSQFFSQETNRNLFGGPSDFTKLNQVGPALTACISDMKKLSTTWLIGGASSAEYWLNTPSYFPQPSQNCGVLKNLFPAINLYFADLGCLHQAKATTGYQFQLRFGEICDVYLGVSSPVFRTEIRTLAKITLGVPTGNVSCYLTSTGVRYEVDLGQSPNTRTIIEGFSYEWEYATLNAGNEPSAVSSYGLRKSFKSTASPDIEVTYDELVNLASANRGATVIIFANTKPSTNRVGSTNTSGKGCYVSLARVLENIEMLKSKEKAGTAPAEVSVIENPFCDANRSQLLNIQKELLKAVKIYPSLASNINKTNGRLMSALGSNCIAEVTVNDFKAEYQNLISAAKSATKKSSTIICSKGNIIRKISAVNPKCPKGFKKK